MLNPNQAESLNSSIDKAKWWIGVLAHHDAITGVSRSFVAENYYQSARANLDSLSASFWSSHDAKLAKSSSSFTNLPYSTQQLSQGDSLIILRTDLDPENFEVTIGELQ